MEKRRKGLSTNALRWIAMAGVILPARIPIWLHDGRKGRSGKLMQSEPIAIIPFLCCRWCFYAE